MNGNDTTQRESDTVKPEKEAPVHALPFAAEKSAEEARPPLYITGFGPLGQSTPDVATGSTPVTRPDD